MAAIQISPFLDSDFEASGIYISDSDDRRMTTFQADRLSYHNGIYECFFEDYVYPIVIQFYVTNFKSNRIENRMGKRINGIITSRIFSTVCETVSIGIRVNKIYRSIAMAWTSSSE